MHPGRLWLWVLGLKWASVQQATAMLSAPRHGEVWRGCPAAPRADRQAQDAREQGPGEQGWGGWELPRSSLGAAWPGSTDTRARPSRWALSSWTDPGSRLSSLLPEPVFPPSIFVPQPGRQSLMLRTLLNPSSVSQPPATSLARQRIIGEERERAVQAYRALKELQRRGAQPPCLPSGKKPKICL